jgi:hypothetical protein
MSSPDGGDYDQWLGEVNQLIARHQAAFGSAGCHLSLQRAQQSYWIQIDVDPSMAVGQPGELRAAPSLVVGDVASGGTLSGNSGWFFAAIKGLGSTTLCHACLSHMRLSTCCCSPRLACRYSAHLLHAYATSSLMCRDAGWTSHA